MLRHYVLEEREKEKQTVNLAKIHDVKAKKTITGIKAMQGLDKQNNSTTANVAMIMLIVINATSIQLIPTTILGLRAQYGSTTSSDIILPTLVSTAVSTILGVMLVKICARFKRRKHK